MQIVNHCLSAAQFLPSPNFDARPDPADISLLVIHCISLPPGEFGGDYIDRLFLNQLDASQHPSFKDLAGLKVSAHLLIRREGELKQYVAFDRRAWHAGASCFQGRGRCNDFSIGIELEGDITQPYTNAQYQALAAASLALIRQYPAITPERITGHSDIAPQRKTDPGPLFDWPRYLRLIRNDLK